jgi:hypothetical protein
LGEESPKSKRPLDTSWTDHGMYVSMISKPIPLTFSIHVCLKSGADEEIVKANITKQVKFDTEISPDEIMVEQPEKIEQRLFARTGLKADWVVDNRELHV